MPVLPVTGQPAAGRTASPAYATPPLLQESLLKPFTRNQHPRLRTRQSSVTRLTASQAQGQQHQHSEPPQYTTRRRLLLAGKALIFAASCPCCVQLAQASDGSNFSYAKDQTGPPAWGGTCPVGMKQSPIDIPLAEHFAPKDNSKPPPKKKIGDIKFEYRQSLPDVGELNFDFAQEVDEAGDVHIKFDQDVEQFGRIKFNFEQKFKQKKNRFGDIKFKYDKQTDATVANPGHGTMQVTPQKGNTAQAAGNEMDLVQWHFHTPSEHTFDGQKKSMEAHLVHKDRRTGGFAVFAVLLQEGDAPPNPALQFALNQAPAAAGTSNNAGTNAMQLMSLVPKQDSNGQRPYVHYEGSLTTPPCSETVQWFVFADTVTIPRSQVEQFQQFCDKASPGLGNARPLQPMNGRTFDYAQFL